MAHGSNAFQCFEVQFLVRREQVRLRSKDFYVYFSDTKEGAVLKSRFFQIRGNRTSCVDRGEHLLPHLIRQFQRTLKLGILYLSLQTSNLQMDAREQVS